MALADLTTIAAVRAWAGIQPSTSDDPIVAGLVTAASRMVLNYINRALLVKTTFVELYDGNGKSRMLLRNWPVASISSLMVNGVTITASASPSAGSPSGYWLDAADAAPPGQMQALSLYGYVFPLGSQNVGLTYVAGYYVSAEVQPIASGLEKIAMNQPYGPWSSDLGVVYSDTGVALTAVTAAPTAGQYQLVASNPGVYQFATADVGRSVNVSYNYVPQDLYQAATELAGERYSYKSRIGQSSRSLGGQETASYSLKGIPDAVKVMIDQYRNIVPY